MSEAGKTQYEVEIERRIRDSDLWPKFESPQFLDTLDNFAETALNSGRIDGALAAVLIFHQLSDEVLKLLLECCRFFVQVSIFPAEITYSERKRLMTGLLID